MAKLILDTCAWLDLAKPRFSEILEELEKQVNNGMTVLLTSEIIIQEWDRNHERILQETVESIRSHAKSALKMTEFLDESSKKSLHDLIGKYKSIEKEQEILAKAYVQRVENLLKRSTIYKINDALKIEMADRAVLKKAPFHNSKNNMADALLYFGAVEYVDKEAQIATDLFFVTSNKNEFCDPSDSNKIHPELSKRNVHYYNNIAHALKMRKELVDEMDEYHEHQLWNWIEMQGEIARGK